MEKYTYVTLRQKAAVHFMNCGSVCRKRSPKGGFFVIIDKGEENVSKRNHGKKHL